MWTGLPFSAPRLRPLLAAAVLVAAIAAAYLNSLSGAFVWDDVPTIADNPAIEHLATALQRPAAVNTTSGRPLVGLSLFLNYALGGRNPAGYHFFNLLVHAAAALALFGFVRRLALLPRWSGRFAPHATGLALAVAAVWALHPLQTQAVTYIIQRSESLMGLCYLLTLYFFLRSADARHPAVWRTLAVVACALGMTAKEVMASAPVVVLLFDRTFLAGTFRRALTAKKWFYGALFGSWLVLAWLVFSLGGNRDGSTGGLSVHAAWGAYWLTQFPAVAIYLKLAFFPHPQIFQYGVSWLPDVAAALPGALVVVPLVGLTVVALWRWPAVGFSGFWFFAVLAVTSVVPGTVDMIVEYRMYLALAPLWMLVAAGLYRWRPRVALGLLAAAAVAFGALTVARNRVYRSPLTLWTDNVVKRPGNAMARYNLGVSLLREPGRTAEAQAQLEAAVRLNPDLIMAHYNLGCLLAQEPGRADQAIAHLETAVRLAPGYAEAQNNLAVLLYQRGRLAEACGHLQAAVRSDPANRGSWLNLVQVLEDLHRTDDAVDAGAALVRAHPDFADGQAKLGALLAARGRADEAVPHLEAALRLDPGQAEAGFYLGTVLAQRRERLPEAVALLEAAARQRPDSALVHFNLGAALLAIGHRLPEAIEQFSAAARLDPRDAKARFNLAVALDRAGGRRREAIAHYRAAAELQPDLADVHFRLARLLAADPQSRPEARAELAKTLALDPHYPGAQALQKMLDALER